jgi:molybdopterin/thiamine biosynthesis adenylyltransferase
VGDRARQEEARAQARHRAQEAQARRGRRREDRLTRIARSWWERDPAALDAEEKELTKAGFRVRREILGRRQLALVLESASESYRVVYYHRPSAAARFWIYTPADPQLSSRGDEGESVLESIRLLRSGGGQVLSDPEHGLVFLPDSWLRDITGAGGTLELGRTRVDPRSFAVRALSGSRDDLGGAAPFGRAFPDRVQGLWARGDVVGLRKLADPIVVAGVEAVIASAHGLSESAVRERSRSGVCALVQTLGSAVDAEWLVVRRGPHDEPLVLSSVADFDPDEFLLRAPFAGRIADKRVALIGCGAVGWTVAQHLARSGVRSFALFDDDVLHAYNMARLGAYLGSADRLKARVLAEQLESINDGIVASSQAYEVGTHVGAAALIAERPDLLINLTGEEISTDETNIAAQILGRPALFAWISNGVLAGRIFRVRPGESACYECVRSAAPAPIGSSGPIPTAPEAAWDGACFNVDAFASAVSRLAVLTLVGEPVSSRNPDHVVLDFGGVAPTTHEVQINRDPRCSVCR